MNKKILIRADGNAAVGAGHIMRCMSIGIEARKQGMDVCFVLADDSFLALFNENEFKVHILNSQYDQMEGELTSLIPIIGQEKPDEIVLDSYYVTHNYVNALRQQARLIYIDDVLSFPYPADLVINYNIYASKEQYEQLYRGVDIPSFLLGSKYAPLRSEFQGGKVIEIKDTINNVLFSAGGADPKRVALRFVKEVISNRQLDDIIFHVVLGSFEPDKDEIEHLAMLNKNIVTHSNVKKMSELMLISDLAVSAAGSTLYELCSCGVPTITYVLADNQIPGANAFSGLGIMINAGDDRCDDNLISNILKKVSLLESDGARRVKMQKEGLEYIDGKGVERIVQEAL